MNPTIVQMIDLMFRGIPETEETNAIREELLTNSQARYEDLLAAGEGPDAALEQVKDSLKGMEEVLDEYRANPSSNTGCLTLGELSPFVKFELMAAQIEDEFGHLTNQPEPQSKSAFTAEDSAASPADTGAADPDASPFAKLSRMAENLEGKFERIADQVETKAKSAFDQATGTGAADPDAAPFAKLDRMAEDLEGKFERIADQVETKAKSAFDTAMEGLRSAMGSVSGLFSQAADKPGAAPDSPTETACEDNPQPAAAQPSRSRVQPVVWQPTEDNDILALTFSPAQVRRLNIQLTGEDIEADPSPDGLIHVEINKSDKDLYLVENADGCLSLGHRLGGSASAASQENEELPGLGGILTGITQTLKDLIKAARTCGDTVQLRLPDGLEQITLSTTSGDVDLNKLRQQALSASSTSGDVELSDCSFTGPVSLNTTSGDVEVDDTVFHASLSLNSTSGEIDISADAPRLIANTTSGDVELTGRIPAVEANSVSGDMDLRIAGQLDICTVNTTSGNVSVTIEESIVPAVRANTVSGNVKVRVPTRPDAASAIHLNSISGNLTVNN